MSKVILLVMVSVVLLFGASEEFYKEQYGFYTGKAEKAYEEWQRFELIASLSETSLDGTKKLNKQIYGFLNDSREASRARAEEAEEQKALKIEKQEAESAHKKYIEYLDKITELNFKAKEELGKLPEWFKIVSEKKGGF